MKKVTMFGILVATSAVLVLIACTVPQGKEQSTGQVALVATQPMLTQQPTNTLDPMWPPQMPSPGITNEAEHPVGSPYVIASPTPLKPEQKIDPILAATMTAVAKDTKIDIGFFIMLNEQAQFSGQDKPADMSQNTYANQKMDEVAKRTQPAVEAVILRLKQEGQVESYIAYTIFNGFYVKGTTRAIQVLSELGLVKSLEAEPAVRLPWKRRDQYTPSPSPTLESKLNNSVEPKL